MLRVSHSTITDVQFSVTSNADRKKNNNVKVLSPDLYDGKYPKQNGIYDAHLGTTDNDYMCGTCEKNKTKCLGHYGTLDLNTYIIQPIFVAEVKKWLKMICINCGELTPGYNSSRLVKKKCNKCSYVQPVISISKTDTMAFFIDSNFVKQRIYPNEIYKIFSKLSDMSLKRLDMTHKQHPIHFITNNIYIPPVTIRPYFAHLQIKSNQSFYDLNNVLQNIVKYNNSISNETHTDKYFDLLQQAYFNLVLGASTTANVKASPMNQTMVKSILRRLVGKKGRIRKNLLGSKVWFIGRSVISGNCGLQIDEVGLPIRFAKILQVNETVTRGNIQRLNTYFINGRKKYPGSTLVYKNGIKQYYNVDNINKGSKQFMLECGDVISRDVISNDVCYFNRQPSLERSSIGVHRIVLLNDPNVKTFQMNVLSCEFYNADFDGDTMNLWVPHDIISRTEASLLSAVHNWFISTKTSGPVNGQIQDSIIGSFLLTRNKTRGQPNRISRFNMMKLFSSVKHQPCLLGKDEIMDSREAVSLLLTNIPINYKSTPKYFSNVYMPYVEYDKTDISVEIKSGKLLHGILDKKGVGLGVIGCINHIVSKLYGCKRALEFIFDYQQVALAFMYNSGFTISLHDMVLSDEKYKRVVEIIKSVLSEADVINNKLLNNNIIAPIGLTVKEFYEQMQVNTLVTPDNILEPILTGIKPEYNGLYQMIGSGAKGNNPNLIHIIAGLGQVQVGGKRMMTIFDTERTTTYTQRFSLNPLDRGYTVNNYVNGLSSFEFVWWAVNGRSDITNKALSTASTGYANRKAIFGLQSCISNYYFNVVINENTIIQLLYGDDGFDPRKIQKIKLPSVFISFKELQEKYLYGNKPIYKKLFDKIVEDRQKYREMFLTLERNNFEYRIDNSVYLPVNVYNLVLNYVDLSVTVSEKELIKNIELTETFIENLVYIYTNEEQKQKNMVMPEYLYNALFFVIMSIRLELNPFVLEHMKENELRVILDIIHRNCLFALIDSGDAVGILAAQSISEPLTQHMLDSHHRSVATSTDATSSITRPNEIFSLKTVDQEKGARMIMQLNDKFNKQKAIDIAKKIELIKFKDIISNYVVLFEKYDNKELKCKRYERDLTWIKEYVKNNVINTPPNDLTHICFRCAIDKTLIIIKNITLEEIIYKLIELYPSYYIIHTTENDTEIIIRVYFNFDIYKTQKNTNVFEERAIAVKLAVDDLLNASIRGIPNIKSTKITTKHCTIVDKDDKLIDSEEIFITARGTNIIEILNIEDIDPNSVVSSSIYDTYNMYGIESARQKIINELKIIMGDYLPNYRHILMYADMMTYLGYPVSLEKNGIIQREKNNILLQMGMSSPIQILTAAAVQNVKSDVYGVASPMLLGSPPALGTLYSDVIINEEFVKKESKGSNINIFLDKLIK